METIGILECSSIAKGVEAADAILKAAEVSLLYAKPVCPGKYTVLVCGDVAAVQAALEAGERMADGYLVDSVVIPRVHPQVVQAIHQAAPPSGQNAVGIMEFFSVTAKAAEISLLDVRLGIGIGGKSFAVLTGDVAAVEEAVQCGMAEGEKRGLAVTSTVIPHPRREIFSALL